jgi:hypothetical protein
MFVKRYLYTLRNKSAVITQVLRGEEKAGPCPNAPVPRCCLTLVAAMLVQILLPLLFAFAAIAVARWGERGGTNEPELRFDFSRYGTNTLRVSSQDAAGNIWSRKCGFR